MSARPIQLLLVEDNAGDARLVHEMLRNDSDASIHHVERLGAAIEHLAANDVDAVLLDLGLSDSQGLDTLRSVSKAAPRVPVVVFTGQDDDTLGRLAVREGAQDYLVKGRVINDALIRTIRYAIERGENRAKLSNLNQVLRAIRNVNRLIVRQRDPQLLIEQACELLVEARGYRGAWIALSHEDGSCWAAGSAGSGPAIHPFTCAISQGTLPPCCALAKASDKGLAVVQSAQACGDCALAQSVCGELSCVTLIRHGEARYGFLGISIPKGFEFDPELPIEVACDLGFALHDIELHDQSQRAKRALYESERKLRAAQALGKVGSWDFDVLTGRITWSDETYVLYERDSRLGPPTLEEEAAYYTPEQAGLFREHARLVIEEGQDRDYDLEAILPSGKSVCFAARMHPIKDEAGRVLRVFGTIQDITQRKQMEDALRRSEQTFRVVFQNVADGIVLMDAHSRRFILANRAVCQMHGYTEEEMIRLTSADLLPRDALDQVNRAFGRALEDETVSNVTLPLRRKDGSTFQAEISATRANIMGVDVVLSCIRDVTEKTKLQASLAQADRLASVGMLAAGVAHEINNPLSYILFNLQSLADDLPKLAGALRRYHTALREHLGPETLSELTGEDRGSFVPAVFDDLQERLRDALSGTKRIKEIARGLGTFSRVERTEVGPANVEDAIEHAINMAYNEIKYRARLIKDVQPVPVVLASDGKLAQVFLNLLINAAHAVGEGNIGDNQIRVRNWADEGYVFVEVSDTGKGIPLECQCRIFEPFFTTKGVGVGSGLGLSICKNIITGFGGDITFTSEVGKGTQFVVKLPLLPADWAARSHAPVPDSEAQIPLARGRVLVVDDEPAICAAVRRMLKNKHDVVTALSAQAGKAILEQDQAFDVLFFDLMMPGMSGMELHQWLGNINPALAEQVVFVTGGAFTPNAEGYLKESGNLRVEKPFDVTDFKRMVGELVLAAKAKGRT